MPLLEQKALNEKNVFKLLKKSVKRVISENGIDSTTKKGNKELDFLLQKLAKFHFSSLEQVQDQGEKIGQVIVKVSKEGGKTFLDRGIIQHISLKEEIYIVAENTAVRPSVTPKPKKTTAQTVVPPKKATVTPTPPAVATPVKEEEEDIPIPEATVGEVEDEEIDSLPATVAEAVAEADEEEEIDVTPPSEAVVDEDEEDEDEELTPEVVAEDEDEDEELVVDEEDEDEEELTPEVVAEDEDEEDEELVAEEEDEDEEELTPEVVAEDEDEEDEELVAEDEDEEDEDEEEPVKTETKSSQIEASKDNASMSLKDCIGEDIKTAMKAQDKIRLETVRGIKKVLIEKEVAVRTSGQNSLTPEQELEVLTQQAKQRRESIEQYEKAGRDDLADKEAQELAIIETYLPKQLSNGELKDIIDEIITSVGATSVKDLGKVMGVAMKQLKGQADGKKIQEMVKNQLT